MSRLGRLVDAGISLVEGLIERFADPERFHLLEEALWRSDDRLAEAYKDVSESEDRYDRLLREIGCALGVEDEGESAIIAAAWEAAGRKEAQASRALPVYSAVIEANRRANREVKRTLTVTAHDLPGFTCKCPECNGDTDGNQ